MQPKSTDKSIEILVEYYSRPFVYFHEQIKNIVKPETNKVRRDFWQLIPEGDYAYLRGKSLFDAYQQSLERRIAALVSNYSVAYWMHLSRRISPYSPGQDKQRVTISIIRSTVTRAIQKYGQRQFCTHVGASGDIDISAVFNGLLLSGEFELERLLLEKSPSQLVLTDFTYLNLIEYYEFEKMCYELWFCQAKTRALQKGAIVRVDLSDPEIIQEYRSQELEWLISNYDEREDEFVSSLTGTVFTNNQIDRDSEIFFPLLNVLEMPVKQLTSLFEQLFNISLPEDYVTNYLPMPLSVKKYLKVHRSFAADFTARNGINFEVILYVITALCYSYFYEAVILKDKKRMLQVIRRGYEGLLSENQIVDIVMSYSEHTRIMLDQSFAFSRGEVRRAVHYLSALTPSNINLSHDGTLRMIVPVREDKLYVDYSVLPVILTHLFAGIDLNRHNFRGKTLEQAFEGISFFLPTKPIKNNAKQAKQIDMSIRIGNILILGECKVVAMSLGYYAGDLTALEHRFAKVITTGLTQADDKATFLCQYPTGRNYNLDGIDFILPIAISPFKEFIPSKSPYYWITKNVPRVLNIREVHQLITDGIQINDTYNLKRIVRN